MRSLLKAVLPIGIVLGMTSASAVEKNPKKPSYDEAKKECLAKNPKLKGKKLQSCIKKMRK